MISVAPISALRGRALNYICHKPGMPLPDSPVTAVTAVNICFDLEIAPWPRYRRLSKTNERRWPFRLRKRKRMMTAVSFADLELVTFGKIQILEYAHR
jgi:hypothetical protein